MAHGSGLMAKGACQALGPSGGSRPRRYQSVAIYRLPPPAQVAQVVTPALEITRLSLFIVFPPPAQEVILALEVTKVLLFNLLPPLQVVVPALEVAKVSLPKG